MKNTESIFGCWIKKNQAFLHPDSLVVFNGSTNIIRGFKHIEILGNLSQRECTTVFYDVMNNHTDNYYFRVEVKNPDWENTYQYNPINISVSGKQGSTVNYLFCCYIFKNYSLIMIHDYKVTKYLYNKTDYMVSLTDKQNVSIDTSQIFALLIDLTNSVRLYRSSHRNKVKISESGMIFNKILS